MDVADLAITAFIKSDRTEADAEDDEAESKTGLGKAREIRPELGACLHEMKNLLAIFFAGRDVGNDERQNDQVRDDLEPDTDPGRNRKLADHAEGHDVERSETDTPGPQRSRARRNKDGEGRARGVNQVEAGRS